MIQVKAKVNMCNNNIANHNSHGTSRVYYPPRINELTLNAVVHSSPSPTTLFETNNNQGWLLS